DITSADRERAGHAWADRYFPMKIRRLGPSLLAGQVVLQLKDTAAYLAEADRLASRWGLTLATEAHILPPGKNGQSEGLRTLTMPMFLTDQHRASYAAHFVFVSMLDRLGSKFHGQPYNLGIWHVPFATEKYSKEYWQKLQSIKRKLDPHHLLNPGKFPRVRSRFFGLTGLLLQSWLFKFGMDFFRILTPLVRLFTHGTGRGSRGEFEEFSQPERRRESAGAMVQSKEASQQHGSRYMARFHVSPIPLTFEAPPIADLSLTATECTSCGNCVSVCPAYLQTHDERTTARGKLWLARRVAEGKTIDQDESDMAFMCLRCRACAEVCQAQLPLMDAWEQLESMLAAQYARPAEKIKTFLSEVERNPEYQQFVGLKRPGNILDQKWLKKMTDNRPQIAVELSKAKNLASTTIGSGQPSALNGQDTVVEEEYAEPINVQHPGGKYHIDTAFAAPIAQPIGKFNIERSDFCINCGQCAEACVYGVHQRSEFDIRRMNAPDDHLCRACFRCIQECPRQALSISIDTTYSMQGRGPYTADVVSSLARQSDEGRIPVTGAGYRGKFGGVGFDGMWTDMSEIVRPTRDGIHGREYISTAIEIGRRVSRVMLTAEGQLAVDALPSLELPIPILFQLPPIHAGVMKVVMSIRGAARQLGTFVLEQTTHSDNIIQLDDSAAILEEINSVKVDHPTTVVVVRVALRADAADRVEQLTRSGVEAIHLAAKWDGSTADGSTLFDALPIVHQQLVAANIRDDVTLLASGGIAAAEHLPKTIILGADSVVIDLPLLAALECPLTDSCFEGHDCPTPLNSIDVKWGRQRIVNLMAAWRNQLLEVMGAMGMREVRRLRGERGRAMFADELQEKLFEPLFVISNE
ncbi:MAG TPA: glutamate synthase-related protein, partial [Anaerolineae bacterium]|nr:glutamate synthase-related protein [Anaerolineae bacterium]